MYKITRVSNGLVKTAPHRLCHYTDIKIMQDTRVRVPSVQMEYANLRLSPAKFSFSNVPRE